MARSSLMSLARQAESGGYAVHWPPVSRNGSRILSGLNTRSDATAASDTDATASVNVHFRGGAINRRGGLAQWLSSALPAPVRSFGFAMNGTSHAPLAFTNKTAYKLADNSGAVGVDTAAGFANDAIVSSVMLLSRLYCLNGFAADFKAYDPVANTWSAVVSSGGASNDFANAAACKWLASSHDRLIAAGNQSFGHMVYVSEVADSGTWKVTNEISCDSGDGTSITNLLNFDDWIVVAKPYSLYTFQPALIGSGSFALYLASRTFGIPGQTAVVWADGVVIFQAQDGQIYALRRSGLSKEFMRPVLLSTKIAPTLTAIDPTYLSTATAVIHNGFYKLNASGKDYWLDLLHSNLSNGEQCVWSQMDWGAYPQPVRFVRPDKQTMFGGGGANDGQVYQHDFGDKDVAAQIQWNCSSAWMDSGKPEILKLLERFVTYAKATTVAGSTYNTFVDTEGSTASYSVQTTPAGGFVMGTSKLGTGTLGVSNELAQYSNSNGGTGRRFRVRFAGVSDGSPMTVRGATLHLVDTGTA